MNTLSDDLCMVGFQSKEITGKPWPGIARIFSVKLRDLYLISLTLLNEIALLKGIKIFAF
jgi:hypothetical protein